MTLWLVGDGCPREATGESLRENRRPGSDRSERGVPRGVARLTSYTLSALYAAGSARPWVPDSYGIRRPRNPVDTRWQW